MKKLVLFLLLLPACGDPPDCYQNYYQNITNFEVNPDMATESGIRVDSGGFKVDLFNLDVRIGMMEWCIGGIMLNNPHPSPEDLRKWQCLRKNFVGAEKLKRSCLVIKVIPPNISKCTGVENIGVPAPEEYCLIKGMQPKPECPCMWRTAVQDDSVIVTPPAMYLWELGRVMTSCNDIWKSPFADCLNF